MSRDCQRVEAAAEAASASSAQQAADMAQQVDAMRDAALSQDRFVKELQVCSTC